MRAFLGVPDRPDGDGCDPRDIGRLRLAEPSMFDEMRAEQEREHTAAFARRQNDEALALAMSISSTRAAPCEDVRGSELSEPGVRDPGSKRVRVDDGEVSREMVTAASAVDSTNGTAYTTRLVVRKSVNHQGVQTDPQ